LAFSATNGKVALHRGSRRGDSQEHEVVRMLRRVQFRSRGRKTGERA
jgi:hypothetical protein